MCLVALAIGCHARFPLVIAANRDEFFDRPAAAMDWWSPGDGLPHILAGRDLPSGGTWLGLTRAGRLALLTNLRCPAAFDPAAPSRGGIVPRWLRGDLSAENFWTQVAGGGHNAFNVVLADVTRGEYFWANTDQPALKRLEPGVHGLSNASLDTPWPKVLGLKRHLKAALGASASRERLTQRLFDVLADRRPASDAEMPSTGVALEWERILSSVFIHAPAQRYGTRCSTVLVVERDAGRVAAHVTERTYDLRGEAVGDRVHRLDGWQLAP